MKNKKQQIFALIFLLVAGLLSACTFNGNKAELDSPFGKEYEVAEIVYRTYVDVSGHEWECSVVEKLELTKQNFDEYLNADAYKDEMQDDTFGWTESSMDAAELRRENANAWKFTTLSPTDGMTDLQYLLQQKDGTVYLAMGYGSDGETSGEAPVFLLMFRMAEKVVSN